MTLSLRRTATLVSLVAAFATALFASAVRAQSPVRSEVPGGGRAAAAPLVSDATEAGLRQFLAPALAADQTEESTRAHALRALPTSSDVDAAFQPSASPRVRAGVAAAFDDPRARLSNGQPSRSQILVSSATTEDLLARNAAAFALPGGMTRIAEQLRPDVRWFFVRFVEPGRTRGLSFSIFVHLGGRWVWFPKPWRMLR